MGSLYGLFIPYTQQKWSLSYLQLIYKLLSLTIQMYTPGVLLGKAHYHIFNVCDNYHACFSYTQFDVDRLLCTLVCAFCSVCMCAGDGMERGPGIGKVKSRNC